MHLDPRLLRVGAIVLAILLLYGSRLSKGSVKETPEGPAFRIKPLFAWSRAIALPAYMLFFAYMMMVQKQTVPWWMALLFIAALSLGIMQMPGTIVFTPMALTQRFWLQPSKSILYKDVVSLQGMQGGRMTAVTGENRIRITHTSNHCAPDEFRQEIERRTGKHVIV